MGELEMREDVLQAIRAGDLVRLDQLSAAEPNHFYTQRGYLVEAIQAARGDVVEFFLDDHDIELNAVVDGNTAMHMAALMGDQDIVEQLFAYGAVVDALNELGKTPAEVARTMGCDAIGRVVGRPVCSARGTFTDCNGKRVG